MSREEFLSREVIAEARVKRWVIVPWTIFMPVTFAMYIAAPALALETVYLVVIRAVPADIALVAGLTLACLCFIGMLHWQLAHTRHVAQEAIRELNLKCPACRKSVYHRLKGGAHTCWNCGAEVFSLSSK